MPLTANLNKKFLQWNICWRRSEHRIDTMGLLKTMKCEVRSSATVSHLSGITTYNTQKAWRWFPRQSFSSSCSENDDAKIHSLKPVVATLRTNFDQKPSCFRAHHVRANNSVRHPGHLSGTVKRLGSTVFATHRLRPAVSRMTSHHDKMARTIVLRGCTLVNFWFLDETCMYFSLFAWLVLVEGYLV